MSHTRFAHLTFGSALLLLSISLLTATGVNAQPLSAGVPGRNVNIVGETPPGYIPENYRQQNEVSCATGLRLPFAETTPVNATSDDTNRSWRRISGFRRFA